MFKRVMAITLSSIAFVAWIEGADASDLGKAYNIVGQMNAVITECGDHVSFTETAAKNFNIIKPVAEGTTDYNNGHNVVYNLMDKADSLGLDNKSSCFTIATASPEFYIFTE